MASHKGQRPHTESHIVVHRLVTEEETARRPKGTWMQTSHKKSLQLLSAIMLSLLTGCSAEPAPPYDMRSYISNQWAGAYRVVTWRQQAREFWGHADALEREATVLAQRDPEQNRDVIEHKLALARELRAAGDACAEQASQLQQLLPFRMLQ